MVLRGSFVEIGRNHSYRRDAPEKPTLSESMGYYERKEGSRLQLGAQPVATFSSEAANKDTADVHAKADTSEREPPEALGQIRRPSGSPACGLQ